MQEEDRELDRFVTYDSSGMRILDEWGRDIDKFILQQDFKIPADYNLTTSVGEYIDTA